MIIKKKEIAAAALVVLIGCAGYLNWSYRDAMIVRDGESYIETGKRLGEAQLVNSEKEVEENNAENTEAPVSETEVPAEETANTESDGDKEGAEQNKDYFEGAKYDRDNARSKSMEILNNTCSNSSFDEATRQKAGDKIIAETQNAEAEQRAENIAGSKGYNEICIYIHDGGAVATVRKDGFNGDDALKITELIQEQTGIQANKIKVVNVE